MGIFKTRRPYETVNFNKIFIIKNFYFLGKKIILLLLCNKFILNELLKSSSRDNSITFIKDLIELNVCDLDVELNFYICVEVYIIIVCSTNCYLHDLSLNRRKSDWFLSNK